MQELSRSVRNEDGPSAAATLGLEKLDLGNNPLEVHASEMPMTSKKADQNISKTKLKSGPSNINNARSWRPEPGVPDYQPLSAPPLECNKITAPEYLNYPVKPKQYQSPYAAKELLALRPAPGPSTLDPQAKQSVSLIRKVPPWRIDKLHRFSSSQARNIVPLVRPAPLPPGGSVSLIRRVPLWRIDRVYRYTTRRVLKTAPPPEPKPQPVGRWFGSAPNPQPKPTAAKFCAPTPEYAITPPPTPIPNPSYIAQSTVPASRLPYPQPLLLVLDLNGTLLYRPKASSHHKARPSLQPFLAHCITNYRILIWSSATPYNVTTICSKIFTAEERGLLLGEWGRDTLDLTPQQYKAKVQVFKRLDRIWDMDRIQRSHPNFTDGGRWSQKNTLLLDDSVLKASAQPHNAVIVPEFSKEDSKVDQSDATDVLGQVVAYLEMARIHDDVSSFVRQQPFRDNCSWTWAWEQKQTATEAKNNSGTSDPVPGRMRTRGRARKGGRTKETTVIDLTGESDEETGGVTL